MTIWKNQRPLHTPPAEKTLTPCEELQKKGWQTIERSDCDKTKTPALKFRAYPHSCWRCWDFWELQEGQRWALSASRVSAQSLSRMRVAQARYKHTLWLPFPGIIYGWDSFRTHSKSLGNRTTFNLLYWTAKEAFGAAGGWKLGPPLLLFSVMAGKLEKNIFALHIRVVRKEEEVATISSERQAAQYGAWLIRTSGDWFECSEHM